MNGKIRKGDVFLFFDAPLDDVPSGFDALRRSIYVVIARGKTHVRARFIDDAEFDLDLRDIKKYDIRMT